MAVVAAALGVAAVAVVVAFLLADGPAAESPPPLPLARELPAGAAGPPRTTTARPADAEPLVVSVVGKVRTPGLVTVPPGARVADAVRAAGGARPGADLATLNLARRVADGEQLYVGVPSPPGMGSALPQAAPPGAGDGTGGSVPVDLNAAGREELESLPGIGEVTARSILDWRARHGRFTAVEQLREVDGIGDKRFERLRDLVSVR
ncbi:competence protein ComEA [Prauserella shujinwangii]|uniref:Competence protein ComEA n=1 Tax=Prauserella shujinwangii TaxID=1453103 RepID=A0A2T0LU41_9PSEU|nr:competence protein ComEA [Prauserella shujinwangii]